MRFEIFPNPRFATPAVTRAIGRSQAATPAAVEVLEPRLLLSSTGLIETSTPFPNVPPGPVATSGGLAFFGSFENWQTIAIFNQATERFSTHMLPANRLPEVAVAVGGYVLFGGPDQDVSTTPNYIVDIYDTATGVWSSVEFPNRGGMSATVVGDKAFFAGGTGSQGDSSEVNIFDASTGQWSTAALSEARGEILAVSVGDYALFAGGVVSAELESDTVDLYDNATGQWSVAPVSVFTDDNFPAVVAGNEVLFPDQAIFNASTGQWSTWSLPDVLDGTSMVAAGPDVFFAGGTNPDGGLSNAVSIYDTDTGALSSATLSVARRAIASATVGDKVIFAGGQLKRTQSDVVDVYNVRTNRWSVTTLAQPELITQTAVVGDQAIFAGGSTSSAGTDIFTDASAAAPILGGTVSSPNRGLVAVTLTNNGTAPEQGPYEVAVYASPSEALTSNAIPLGSITVPSSLGYGDSITLNVPITIPAGTPAGSYHIIAAAGQKHHLLVVATQRHTFTVAQAATSVQRAELVLPAAAVFSTGPAIAVSVLKDAEEVLG